MISNVFVCLLLFVLVAVIGFFSSSETAYLSLTKIKVRSMIRKKLPHAHTVAKLHEDIESLLTLVLVGTNFVNTFASSLATMFAVAIVGEGGIGIATLVITFFMTTFGQIIPKTFAVTKPEQTASHFAPFLLFLRSLFLPVIFVFTAVSKTIAALADKIWCPTTVAATNAVTVTTEELQTLFDVGEHEGTLEKSETRMLNKVFEFSDLSVHDIMRHRYFVRGVPQTADRAAVIAAFYTYGYSRLVVYEPATENIVGVIDYKSVLFDNAANVSSRDNTNIAHKKNYLPLEEMRPPLFVPETFSLFELLEKFREASETFAVVLDEQGETAGIATIDDVMRVVFDRMTDDNLAAGVPPEARIKIISEKEFVVPGDMKISDANEMFGFALKSEEFNTIGGWLLEQFGALPRTGEVFVYRGSLFIVDEQSKRRIQSIRIKKM